MQKRVWPAALMLAVLAAAGCSSSQPLQRATAPQAGSQQAVPIESPQMNTVRHDSASAAPTPNTKAGLRRAPNGAEYDAMYFKHYGTNPFVSTDEDHLSTFAVDVDTGSYTVVRNYVSRGSLPPEEAVRVEELINYFPASYPPPQNDVFRIQIDGGQSPFGKGYHLLRIGIKGKEIAAENRKPARLVFVIDVSGSMARENRLELVKKSLRVLVGQLNEDDQVGIVVYGSQGRRLLEPTSVRHKENILQAIDSLAPEGSTNAEEGLRLGYAMAADAFDEEANNRVILCSDGVANVGETGAEGILQVIGQYARRGIMLNTFGFGMGNYNDVLMEQLADKGDGTYAYIDSFSEARRVFAEALTGTLQTIAKDVKVQVDFDPQKVERYRLLGYENRDVRDEDFRNDKVDGGEIGSGHTVTALYEVKLKDGVDDEWGTVRLRYQDVDTGKGKEIAQPIRIGKSMPRDLQFLAAVAEYGEIMRGSYWAREGSLQSVLALAEATASGAEQLEFVRLVKDSIALKQ
ncbi:VWA domain-containing protein [Brevibacillus sp. SYP-B805]|uniref:vWA domain-containing protein n=1 Tax=Brevibacillus sp. SYP-B805 TaxID=1578199 RepID=UPI0013EB2DF4|nr:VWA domain-containing protein [Brevibacillus sp. SYP-B805]NGQ95141.1 VWA domain-containing protein [Brevibacillus sp. SYP-B805]